MKELARYVRAEFQKTAHGPVRAAHAAIPVGIAAVFLLYSSAVDWNVQTKTEAYYQLLGMGFPFLIGLFCALLAEQESAAGAFQNMLCARKRPAAFFGKLLLLVLFGTGAVLLAAALFGAGLLCFGAAVPAARYLLAALVLLGGNLFLYVLHLMLALRFGTGVTVGLGLVESLFAALLCTGMGEGVWAFVPAAWGTRLVTYFLRGQGICAPGTDVRLAVCLCAAATLGGCAAFGLWACRFDGAGGSE